MSETNDATLIEVCGPCGYECDFYDEVVIDDSELKSSGTIYLEGQ